MVSFEAQKLRCQHMVLLLLLPWNHSHFSQLSTLGLLFEAIIDQRN
jgi:hypothetical protein